MSSVYVSTIDPTIRISQDNILMDITIELFLSEQRFIQFFFDQVALRSGISLCPYCGRCMGLTLWVLLSLFTIMAVDFTIGFHEQASETQTPVSS